MDCVFCKIAAGELPSSRVYEDDEVVAFMDIGPLVKGHTLVVPKRHFDPITDAPDETLARVMAVVKKIVAAQLAGLGADGVNVHQSNGAVAGQVVPHLHFHVVPRFKDDRHTWNWRPRQYADKSEMDSFGAKIREAIVN